MCEMVAVGAGAEHGQFGFVALGAGVEPRLGVRHRGERRDEVDQRVHRQWRASLVEDPCHRRHERGAVGGGVRVAPPELGLIAPRERSTRAGRDGSTPATRRPARPRWCATSRRRCHGCTAAGAGWPDGPWPDGCGAGSRGRRRRRNWRRTHRGRRPARCDRRGARRAGSRPGGRGRRRRPRHGRRLAGATGRSGWRRAPPARCCGRRMTRSARPPRASSAAIKSVETRIPVVLKGVGDHELEPAARGRARLSEPITALRYSFRRDPALHGGRRSVTPRPWLGVAGGAAAGAAFLIWMAGVALLDPTRIEWLMKLDWVPHYFGWFYFRTEPWQWPPGTIHGYYAPLGTSIGLTDSIPLAAYLLKPSRPGCPSRSSTSGCGCCCASRCRARSAPGWSPGPRRRRSLQALGAALFVLLPTLLTRIGHAALCSHWLVLWALVIATRPPAARVRPAEWAALGLVRRPHPTVSGSDGAAAAAGDRHRHACSRRLPAASGRSSLAVATTVVGWWLSGLFVLSGEGSLAARRPRLLLDEPARADHRRAGGRACCPSCRWPATGRPTRAFTISASACSALLAVAAAVAARARLAGASRGAGADSGRRCGWWRC